MRMGVEGGEGAWWVEADGRNDIRAIRRIEGKETNSVV